jgi:hypothetical protein
MLLFPAANLNERTLCGFRFQGNNFFQLSLNFTPGYNPLKIHLHTGKIAVCQAEIPAKTQVGIRRNSPFPVDNVTQTVLGYTKGLCQRVLAYQYSILRNKESQVNSIKNVLTIL